MPVWRWSLLKHHRLISIHEDPVLDMPPDGAGQYDLFQVASLLDEILD
jgi:hypothetical protein